MIYMDDYFVKVLTFQVLSFIYIPLFIDDFIFSLAEQEALIVR